MGVASSLVITPHQVVTLGDRKHHSRERNSDIPGQAIPHKVAGWASLWFFKGHDSPSKSSERWKHSLTPVSPATFPSQTGAWGGSECPTPSLWKTLIFIQCRFHINFDLNIIHPDDWIFAKRLKSSVSLALSCPWLWELISIVCDQRTAKGLSHYAPLHKPHCMDRKPFKGQMMK